MAKKKVKDETLRDLLRAAHEDRKASLANLAMLRLRLDRLCRQIDEATRDVVAIAGEQRAIRAAVAADATAYPAGPA